MLKDKQNNYGVLNRVVEHSGKIPPRTGNGLESDDTEGREAREEAL